jgi:hypothetical protein
VANYVESAKDDLPPEVMSPVFLPEFPLAAGRIDHDAGKIAKEVRSKRFWSEHRGHWICITSFYLWTWLKMDSLNGLPPHSFHLPDIQPGHLKFRPPHESEASAQFSPKVVRHRRGEAEVVFAAEARRGQDAGLPLPKAFL